MSERSWDLRSEDLGPGLSLCGVICEVGVATPALIPQCLTRNKGDKIAKTVSDSGIFYYFKTPRFAWFLSSGRPKIEIWKSLGDSKGSVFLEGPWF